MDKMARALFEYKIARNSWSGSREVLSKWRAELRHNMRIDRIQDAEGAAGFGDEYMTMNDR